MLPFFAQASIALQMLGSVNHIMGELGLQPITISGAAFPPWTDGPVRHRSNPITSYEHVRFHLIAGCVGRSPICSRNPGLGPWVRPTNAEALVLFGDDIECENCDARSFPAKKIG